MSRAAYPDHDEAKGGSMQIDDETLMALADGALDPDTAANVRRRIADDPAAQSRLHQFQETRRLLSALRTPQTAPADTEDPLAAMIRKAAVGGGGPDVALSPAPDTVVVPAAANLNRKPWFAAAAAAAVVALGLGWWNSTGQPNVPSLGAAEIAALETLPSGQLGIGAGQAQLAMIASYRLADGTFCREFESGGRTTLACRDNAEWDVRLSHVAAGGGQDYRPASGGEALEDQLAAIGATEPLSAEQEMQALRE